MREIAAWDAGAPDSGRGGVLLKLDSTCWRLETADRVGLIIDMADYFAAAKIAMSKATRSIHVLNWAFDPDTLFLPDENGEGPPSDRFGPFLRALAAEKPEVDVRILCWRSALPVAATQNFFPHRAKECFKGSRVAFRLDASLPLGACHHQKAIIVDERLAFCGGGDIAPDRWDTTEHKDDDPRRQMSTGKEFPSRHETMSIVDGDAAAALGELFRWRWERSSGEILLPPPPEPDAPDLWPKCQSVHITNARVGLSRTEPRWRHYREVRENEALHLAAIAAAKHCIYMENQYFASPIMAEALAARLGEKDGPEIVLISTQHSPSWFDQMTMDRTRVLFLKRLKSVDKYDRCRAYSPVTGKGRTIIVHSKLTIIDDMLVRIGSANLNNRSTGFDTECDLSVEALRGEAGADQRIAIRAFRSRLLGHWLEQAPETVDKVEAELGGLHQMIQRLDPDDKLLKPIPLKPIGAFAEFIATYHLGDPAGPSDSWRPWMRRAALRNQLKTVADQLKRVGLESAADELSPETV